VSTPRNAPYKIAQRNSVPSKGKWIVMVRFPALKMRPPKLGSRGYTKPWIDESRVEDQIASEMARIIRRRKHLERKG